MALIKMNFLSKYLGMQTNVTICLPSFSFADVMGGRAGENYVKGMQYQTLYLLHGGSGDDSDYVNFSNILRYADDHKLAVVMPADHNADYTDAEHGPKYWKYLTKELPVMCQSLFALSDRQEDNFVGGLSMGAHGAMKWALMDPDRFAAALIMSGAARHPDIIKNFAPLKKPKQLEEMDPDLMPMPEMKYIYGDLDAFKGGPHDAYAAAKRNAEAGKMSTKFFFTCGGNDGSLDRCRQGYEELKALGYDASFEEVPGYAHEWDFWDLSLRKAIREWLPIRHAAMYPGEE